MAESSNTREYEAGKRANPTNLAKRNAVAKNGDRSVDVKRAYQDANLEGVPRKSLNERKQNTEKRGEIRLQISRR